MFVDDLERPVLRDDDRHHLARVLRVRPGAVVTAADGSGRWRRCRFGDALEPDGPVHAEPDLEPPITVAFSVVKGDRTEWAVQKLTEIGVDRLVPVFAARSVVRWDPDRVDRHHARLQRVAREAAMQARRARLPSLHAPLDVVEVLSWPGTALADPAGDPPGLHVPTVVVGPEGGFTDDERAAATARVSLGPTVLRAETAAVVAGAWLAGLRAGLLAPGPGGSVHRA